MAKGGVTKRIEDTIKALDSGQLKRALFMTENNAKLERHHQWVQDAARTCLANRDDKAACERAISDARNKIQGTITSPLDDTSLDGLEEYMTEEQIEPQPQPATAEKTDEELYEECEECHVAVAAAAFADICAEKPEEAGGCELIGRSLENPDTEPVDWIKAMVQTAETATGKAKEEMAATVSELAVYLERRNSPFLKALEEESDA